VNRMPGKYAAFAHRARDAVENDSAAFQECRCPGNLELVLFLGYALPLGSLPSSVCLVIGHTTLGGISYCDGATLAGTARIFWSARQSRAKAKTLCYLLSERHTKT